VISDRHGETYAYAFDPYLGVAIGLIVGFVSTLFGVSGGVIFVPAMVLLLRFPAYIATATSAFILVFTSGMADVVHVVQGSYSGVVSETAALSVGVLVGAQIGALLSQRLVHHQVVITRLLSAAMVVVGVRLLAGALL
jgi:uncharacterized membrane protein YfcA